jgi:hypothetical protein
MTNLNLRPRPDNKLVRITVELPTALHRIVIAYAEVLSQPTGQILFNAARLIMATDRALRKFTELRIENWIG